MVDQFVGLIAYVIVSVGGTFLSSWMSFNASGEKFDPRKHGNALITGALSGLGFAIGNIVLEMFIDVSDAQFAFMLFGAFWAALGIDRARASGSKMSARNAVDGEIKPSET